MVMMSGQAHIEMAVRATRLGALDFLEKPISTDKLLLTVENALKLQRLESENRQLRQRLGKHEIVWKGEAMQRVMAQLERVAASESRVCILGETGTGKELVARTMHERSSARGRTVRHVELRGGAGGVDRVGTVRSREGIVHGRVGPHIGKFEQADQGTIFLDEIGDMPLNMQAKLLRVLEEGEVERIGGDKPVAVNVRVVVATHRDLEARVREEKFRQDLFHRIYVFPLVLPPLARTARRHSGAGRAFRGASVRAKRVEAGSFHCEAMRGAAVASLAGKCPRTAQHGRAPDAACDRRSG